MIPYDRTYITKEIIIGECVWIGSRVMILEGTHWCRCNNTGWERSCRGCASFSK